MKFVLLLVLVLTSCFEIGDFFTYRMNRDRTSGFIEDSNLQLEVIDAADGVFLFELKVYVLPAFGMAENRTIEKTLPQIFFTEGTLDEVIAGRVIEDKDFRLRYNGPVGDCHTFLIDQIEDTEDFQNMEVIATYCDGDVPFLDVSFDSGNFFITIGYDN